MRRNVNAKSHAGQVKNDEFPIIETGLFRKGNGYVMLELLESKVKSNHATCCKSET